MPENNELGLRQIRRALISVSDKTGIVDFARQLQWFGVEIISTGGTAGTLREEGIKVRDVSELTGFPELMNGRVKTLHPKIHGALLGLRDNPEHLAAMQEHEIEPIDMVVINLYPFEETIAKPNFTYADAIENIDIGGVTLIRAAAKNHERVTLVCDPSDYHAVLEELRNGGISGKTRTKLAIKGFAATAHYDTAIHGYLKKQAESWLSHA